MSQSYKKYEKLMALKERFETIISKWLKIRDESKDMFWYEPSDENKHKPRYVMRMIREINDEMPTPMLDKVNSVETRAAGHTDYFSKFALYCAELHMYGESPLYWN
jgi:hypothetical protein